MLTPFIYLFIYLLGANQKEHTWQMVFRNERSMQSLREYTFMLTPMNKDIILSLF